jgi:hypothetical protein
MALPATETRVELALNASGTTAFQPTNLRVRILVKLWDQRRDFLAHEGTVSNAHFVGCPIHVKDLRPNSVRDSGGSGWCPPHIDSIYR